MTAVIVFFFYFYDIFRNLVGSYVTEKFAGFLH